MCVGIYIRGAKFIGMTIPRLLATPRQHHDPLTIKATLSGIIQLRTDPVTGNGRKYLSRYAGSKYSAVDINGNLWQKATELKKQIAKEGKDKKKPGRKKPTGAQKFREMTEQISDNLSTENNNSGPQKQNLSTVREYRVNKKEVRQRLLGMINTKQGKKELYFFTVTFPAGTSDEIAYQVYNVWLTSLRQYRMLRQYLWVAERQQNGTVHFHIAIPHKMNVQRANAMMAGTLKTFAKRGEIPFTVHQCKRYNGVDIAKHRATRRVTNFAIKKGSRALVTYLTKYVTKNDGTFQHLAWHNSRGYSSIFTGVTFSLPEFQDKLEWQWLLREEKTFEGEFFTFIPWLGDPPELLTKHLHDLNSHLLTILENKN